jgi:hypothetical protein
MIGVVWLAFALRVENLDQYPPGLSADEAGNTMDGFHIGQALKYPVYENPARPEPLYQALLAVTARTIGPTVWAFRFTAVLVGTLTIAAVYWTMRQALYDVNPVIRGIAGLAAAGALAVALNHVVLSRSVYRATPQPLFMLLFTGLLLRGLRSNRRRDFILSGVFLAAALYTYTAALILPAALVPLVLHLLITRRRTWRSWLPNLIWLGIIFAVIMLPVGVRLLDNSDAVLGRTQEVNRGEKTWERRVELVLRQFFTRGDINPQYNVDSAPMLPPVFDLIFRFGLLALLVRIRQPSSILIAALLVLCAIPAAAANEIPHGLRIAGEYAVFPLVIGTGVACVLALANYLPRADIRRLVYAVILVAVAALTVVTFRDSRATYAAYWHKPLIWEVYDRQLPSGEWFFRTSERDFGRWLAAAQPPLLVPLDELNRPTTRTWLLPEYPDVTTAGDSFVLPAGTRLVVPWWLEKDDLLRETRAYGLLQNGTITLLPPLSVETHAQLLAEIDDAEAVTRPNHDLMARVKPVPDDFTLAFEPRANRESPLAIFDGQIALLGWRGPDTLRPDSEAQTLTYTLDWAADGSARHQYSTFVQLQTQDQQRLAGDDVLIWRWLYPSTLWSKNDQVPDPHMLTIPANLEPGAYRLVVGAYVTVFVGERVDVTAPDGTPLGDMATVGWIKVPQRETPEPDPAAVPFDATLGDSFALRSARADRLEDGRIRLVLDWEALTDRPGIDATIFVHALGPDGTSITQDDTRPWGGSYPTFIWDAGERVRTEHILSLDDTAPENVTLIAGMYTFPDLTRLSVQQNGTPEPDGAVQLGRVASLLVD